MNEVVIEKKKYVIISKDEYNSLRKRAASKFKPEKKHTIVEARAQSKKLIREWGAFNKNLRIGYGEHSRSFLVH